MYSPSLLISRLFLLLALLCATGLAVAAPEDERATPIRLSYLEGDVSFWRYGADDWVDARVNTPLAEGDALYADKDGTIELQMGSRAFIRADEQTQLSLVSQTPDYTQIKVTQGLVSFDLRSLPQGAQVEVDTPIAAFTIDRAGYYRVDVDDEVHFVTRRGGQATVSPAGGRELSVYPSEEIVVRGDGSSASASTYAAPAPDAWDRWNMTRTEDLIDATSERYLSPGIAGGYDLDYYGSWRVVPQYGTVWIPNGMAPGWAPYSTGHWVWDPYYQWTWIDDAPWGWAPYHYGRWVYLGGYWAWAPGPVVRRVVYSPALVAFYGVGAHVSVGFSLGGSGIGWVALSWGEPLVPWWGRVGFVGRPWWGGWGGPRVVNNVVVRNTTVVNVTNITYVNSRVRNAVIATSRDRFGTFENHESHVRLDQPKQLSLVRGALPVKPEAARVFGGAPKAQRPPERVLSRSVVTTRAPRESRLPWKTEAPKNEGKDRYIVVPKQAPDKIGRPEFGAQVGEERSSPAPLPRFEEKRRFSPPDVPERRMPAEQNRERGGEVIQRTNPPEREEMRPPVRQEQKAMPERREEPPARMQQAPQQQSVPQNIRNEARPESSAPSRPEVGRDRERAIQQRERTELPGQPANRIYRGRSGDQRQDQGEKRGPSR